MAGAGASVEEVNHFIAVGVRDGEMTEVGEMRPIANHDPPKSEPQRRKSTRDGRVGGNIADYVNCAVAISSTTASMFISSNHGSPSLAMSTQHSTKARHYAALAARIRELRGNLDETEQLMGHMSDHLLGMRKLAAANGAQ